MADRKDLRADHHDLRTNPADFKQGPMHTPHTDSHQMTASATTHATTNAQAAKLQINSSTVANNAAQNQKNQQNAQHTHRAWYHYLF